MSPCESTLADGSESWDWIWTFLLLDSHISYLTALAVHSGGVQQWLFLTSADSDVTAGSLLSCTNLGQENSPSPAGSHMGFVHVSNHQYWQNSGPDNLRDRLGEKHIYLDTYFGSYPRPEEAGDWPIARPEGFITFNIQGQGKRARKPRKPFLLQRSRMSLSPATLTCCDGTTSASAAAKQTAQLREESGRQSLLWRLLWIAWVLRLSAGSPFLQSQEEYKVKWPTPLNHHHREAVTFVLHSLKSYTCKSPSFLYSQGRIVLSYRGQFRA